MKKRGILEKKQQRRLINNQNQNSEYSLPRINDKNNDKKITSKVSNTDQPKLLIMKKKLQFITKRSTNVIECKNQSPKPQKVASNKFTYSVRKRTLEKKQSNVLSPQISKKNKGSQQVKSLFSDIKNRLNTLNKPQNMHHYSEKAFNYSFCPDKKYQNSILVSQSYCSLQASPCKNPLKNRKQMFLCTKSIVQSLEDQINRLENFRRNNQQVIKAYLSNKIDCMKIKYLEAQRKKSKKYKQGDSFQQ